MVSPSSEHTVVLHVTPGEVLDERWRIEERIGQGAMGSVFRGRELKSGSAVAVKVLAPEHCRKPKVLARFEREADLMVQLRHPNIVQLLGHGRLRALPYLVMEYLEGMTLSEVLEAKGGRLPVADTIALVKPIASGLAFLHRNGLVHRDIKPQNIFLTSKGRVTILDLGVVRDQHNPGLTKPGAMVGTPYYMSPEQIAGLEDVDRRTDVYALAAMSFELLTGRPPFLGSNNFEVLYGHKNSAVPDAAALVRSITKPVANALIHGMAKRREERPETASEFAAELEAAAGAKKIELATAFSFIADKLAERSKKKAPDEGEGTRLISKLPPRKPSEEIPLAANEDVVSVANALSDSSPDIKTVIFSTEKTYVGPLTDDSTGPTMALTPLKTGQVRIVASHKGRAVMASFTCAGTKGLTPKTLTLPPGRYTLKAELTGSRSLERKVEITVGAIVNVRLDF